LAGAGEGKDSSSSPSRELALEQQRATSFKKTAAASDRVLLKNNLGIVDVSTGTFKEKEGWDGDRVLHRHPKRRRKKASLFSRKGWRSTATRSIKVVEGRGSHIVVEKEASHLIFCGGN